MSDFVSVGKVKDFEDGKVITVAVNDHDITLAKIDGKFYAIDNTCPHKQGQLGDGSLFGYTVVCPLHSWEFDVSR